jgi:epoxyqueuosine reductase
MSEARLEPSADDRDAAAGADLRRALELRARELGFARFGVAAAAPIEPAGSRLHAWVDAGRHATMGWMADTADVRADVRHEGMLPSARTVVVLVTPYARDEGVPPGVGRVARYARGRDYHNVVGKRLRKLASIVREAGHDARASVDSLPVYERAWAERAGVGFIGKNCCLIVPGIGSHVFLSTLVTSAELPVDSPMKPRCGECRLCLDACPTEAFVDARELDARRCISYLTIEHRGPIDPDLRAATGDWLFGCDACQDVCPFNRTAAIPPEATEPFASRQGIDAESIVALDDSTFDVLTRGSPLRRARREGLVRNAVTVLGNTRDRRHLPVLREMAAADPSPVVRDAASWALAAITSEPPDEG